MIDFKHIKNVTFLKGCSEKQLRTIADYLNPVYFKKNSYIYYQNDPAKYVYLIKNGSVTLTKNLTDDRSNRIVNLSSGMIFGTGEIFFDTYYLNAYTCEKTELLSIHKKDFFLHFLTIPILNKKIMTDFAGIIRVWVNLEECTNSEDKLLLYFYFLSQKYGKKGASYIIIEKKITQEHIAEILNLTREYISKTLKKLKKKGVLFIKRRKIILQTKWLDERTADKEKINIFKWRFQDNLDL